MKNIVFIPCYNNFKIDSCIATWKHYCSKHNLDLIIADNEIAYDFKSWGNACFEYWKDDRLKNLDYEKVLIVDSDTMVRFNAPNIFELGDICVVRDCAGASSGQYHFNQYLEFNSNVNNLNPHNYFNAGVQLFTKDVYLQISKEIPRYYEYWASFHSKGLTGPDACDQTPVNIVVQELFKDDTVYLDEKYNNMVMSKYEDLSFINDSYIWHFTGLRLGGYENKINVINEVYAIVKDYYI